MRASLPRRQHRSEPPAARGPRDRPCPAPRQEGQQTRGGWLAGTEVIGHLPLHGTLSLDGHESFRNGGTKLLNSLYLNGGWLLCQCSWKGSLPRDESQQTRVLRKISVPLSEGLRNRRASERQERAAPEPSAARGPRCQHGSSRSPQTWVWKTRRGMRPCSRAGGHSTPLASLGDGRRPPTGSTNRCICHNVMLYFQPPCAGVSPAGP